MKRIRALSACIAWAVPALTLLTIGVGSAVANPVGVDPATVDATLATGGSITVDKTVNPPAIPPLVDICLVEDETGSFADDIANLQALAGPGGPLITALDGTGVNYASCAFGFRDFDQDNWGSSGDWVVRRLADVTAGGGGFVAGVPGLTAAGGNDTPEAQLEALHYIADTAHLAIDSNGDASKADTQDTPAGLQPTWRPLARRVALLATDAECHVTGDEDGWPGDAGTTSAATTAGILLANNITVIGLTPGGAGTNACVDTLAAGTGGTVQATTSTGADIVNAIVAGLQNLPVTVSPSVGPCDPDVTVTITPPSQTVTSGTGASFSEQIDVSATAAQGSTLHCAVTWLIDGNVVTDPTTGLPDLRFVQQISIDVPGIGLTPEIGTNEAGTDHIVTATVSAGGSPLSGVLVSFSVLSGPNAGQTSDPSKCTPPGCTTDAAGQVSWKYTGAFAVGTDVIQACFTFRDHEFCSRATKDWIDTTPPEASCRPSTNPAGSHIPPAGSSSLPGPKGGHNEDGFYQLFGTDLVGVASILVHDSGSSFISDPFANGDKVKIRQVPGATPRDTRPGPGVIVSKLRLKGDAVLVVTDTSGNVTRVSCLVPPPRSKGRRRPDRCERACHRGPLHLSGKEPPA